MRELRMVVPESQEARPMGRRARSSRQQFTRHVMAAHGVTREHVQLQILGLYVLFSLKWLICLAFRF
jgi:hypothetical protein